MFASEAKGFIYLHVQKTAGHSICTDLAAQVPDLTSPGYANDTARDAIAIVGRDAWDRAFTFAFVRNPWDRLVSWWSMIDHQRPRLPLYRVFPNAKPRFLLWRYALDNARTFEQFILRCSAPTIPDPVFGEKSFVRPQTDYLTDESGRVCVDFIGRYESLEADYRTVRDRLGLAPSPLPRIRHKSRHAHYSTYYNDETRRIVAQRFAADIERFGYRFEEGPALTPELKPSPAPARAGPRAADQARASSGRSPVPDRSEPNDP